jgi:Resolvase, N terminal domain/Recombinase
VRKPSLFDGLPNCWTRQCPVAIGGRDGTLEDAGYSAKDLKRPGVREALRALGAGEANALVVARLDRLSRSMLDFAALMATAQKQQWALVALDCAVDAVVRRIQRQRARGDSLRAIADSLNRARVPTAQGGAQWYAATVRGILARST